MGVAETGTRGQFLQPPAARASFSGWDCRIWLLAPGGLSAALTHSLEAPYSFEVLYGVSILQYLFENEENLGTVRAEQMRTRK